MDELFKNNSYRILELFIEEPTKEFSARGIAREVNITHATVLKYLKQMLKLELIIENKKTLYPTYYANTENEKYIFYKKNHILFKIKESGLIEFIQSQVLPSCIVLFGSCAKGYYNQNSDIDIFVEAEEKKIDHSKYEKKLKREINLLYEKKFKDLSKELRNNIIEGVRLYGFIRI